MAKNRDLTEVEIAYLNDLVDSGRVAEFGYALYNMTNDLQGITLAHAATGTGAVGGAYWWIVNRTYLAALNNNDVYTEGNSKGHPGYNRVVDETAQEFIDEIEDAKDAYKGNAAANDNVWCEGDFYIDCAA